MRHPPLHPRHRLPRHTTILQIHPPYALKLPPNSRQHRRRSPLLRTLHKLIHPRRRFPLLHLLLGHVFLQPGPDAAGHEGDAVETVGGVAGGNFVGHVDVCGFGLAVAGPGGVGCSVGEVVGGELDFAGHVAGGGDVDDAGVEGGG